MTDRVLFDLADGWALGADSNQWVVLRRRNFRTQRGWKSVAFVGSTKRILRRVLVESGVEPTPEAQAKLDALPEWFRDWRTAPMRKAAA